MPLLRYSIDSWDKLTKCRSNLSSDYSIVVVKCNDPDLISGTFIKVMHRPLGCMFVGIVGAKGEILDPTVPEMSQDEILDNLKRFGFIVRFTDNFKIADYQLKILRSMYDLGFDRLREISLPATTVGGSSDGYIVVFDSTGDLGDWLNNWYGPTRQEFQDAVLDGKSYVIYKIAEGGGEDWSWVHDTVFRLADLLSMHHARLYSLDRRNYAEPDMKRGGAACQ